MSEKESARERLFMLRDKIKHGARFALNPEQELEKVEIVDSIVAYVEERLETYDKTHEVKKS